ncbi:hypothetical protein B0I35DRAFT_483348 [Stachybotrys elegans]|uniref:Uncharacterized protein n=1 Tax=Stachybotrys elegans TaxID=80388 RepID=A0A8K0WLH8_9HYPO|nr:hypothetical protein B0I35DRAFT_483348 [Stachybotrys elegans]
MDHELRLIYSYLDQDLNENALFLCERLRVIHPNDLTWVHLQSLSCLRLGRHGLAADFSREHGSHGRHLGCSYVFAQACLRQKQYADGISALRRAEPLWRTCENSCSSSKRPPWQRFIPSLASVHLLLGKLHQANSDNKTAAKHFVTALESDPFMWDAFTNLCDTGAMPHVSNTFKLPGQHHNETSNQRESTPAPDNSSPTAKRGRRNRRPLEPSPSDHSQQAHITAGKRQDNEQKRATEETADGAKSSGNQGTTNENCKQPGFGSVSTETRDFQSGFTSGENDPFVDRPSGSNVLPAPQRRSARLRNQGTTGPSSSHRPAIDSGTAKATSQRSTKPCRTRPVSQKTSGTKQQASEPQSSGVSLARDVKAKRAASSRQATKTSTSSKLPAVEPDTNTALPELLCLLEKIGLGYYHLARFQPKACLDAFSSLPMEQQVTPWILAKVGRAQYELMRYDDAKLTFQALRKAAPAWMEDLEVYSTTLWHLKDDVTLAYLAHDLSENHYLSPQTWCAAGNSFSLNHDRNEAIRCFRRASQLSPQLARAYSLLGYEHIELEEYDAAAVAFRKALQIESRHYLALVGLGRVREKLGQYGKALKHYIAAEKINPSNAVLMKYIANALEKTDRYRQALEYLSRGLKLEPRKPIVALLKAQAAGIYLRFGRPAVALQELQTVAEVAPDEPRVHFLLGQAHAMSGPESRGKALQAYTTALSLAPLSEEIKLAIAALGCDS